MEGVLRTRVGYSGGRTENPTYYDLGDHSETIQLDYDPNQVSYSELLDMFWASHRPTVRPFSRQYASIIFYHDEEQRRLAEESKRRIEEKLGRVFTEIVPAARFYWAEDYHQKYYLRNLGPVAEEYLAIYPRLEDWVNSTAVTRANGYAGGHGAVEQFERDLERMGLSAGAQQALRAAYARWRR